MDPPELERAVEAGRSAASALGLRADDAVVLHNSNRIAVRLTPADVLARVAPLEYQAVADDLELEVARRLAATGSPVAEPDARVEARVYERDGFAVTLWTYYAPVPASDISPADYSDALRRLHDGMRQLDLSTPHFMDRVAEAEALIADREQTPELLGADRDLLGDSLRRLGRAISGLGADEQVLHGEPHVGTVLRTPRGLLFIDLETCCRGPVEFDIAHALLPSEDGRLLSADHVCAHYPGADRDLVEQSRILIWAMITTWRWRRDDQLPNGRYWRVEGLNQLRAALDRSGRNESADHA